MTDTDPTARYTAVIPDVCQPSVLLLSIFWGQLGIVLLALGQGVPLVWKQLGLMSCYAIWLTVLILPGWCLSMRGLHHLSRRYTLTRNLSAPVILLTLWILAIVITVLGAWIVASIGNNPILALLPATVSTGVFILQSVLCSTVMSGVLLRYLFLQQRWQIQQALTSRSELRHLQSRLRPHFLYNTLNTIAALIEEQPAAAVTAIEDLSDLLRLSLQPNTRLQPLAQEIEVCQKYLALLQWRLGKRLQLQWNIDSSVPTTTWQIPPMALQTLLENAVVHGIQQSTSGGTLGIVIQSNAGYLHIKVSNPLPEPKESTVDQSTDKPSTRITGTGTALQDLRRRLNLLFDGKAKLQTGTHGQTYIAELQLPAAGSR